MNDANGRMSESAMLEATWAWSTVRAGCVHYTMLGHTLYILQKATRVVGTSMCM